MNRLNFDNEPRVQERQHMMDQQSCISDSVAYPAIPIATRSTSPDMTTVFRTESYGRFIEIQSNLRRKKLHGLNLGPNFLGGSFNNRDNVRATIQLRRESQPQHLKQLFLENRPIQFYINSTSVLRPVKRN